MHFRYPRLRNEIKRTCNVVVYVDVYHHRACAGLDAYGRTLRNGWRRIIHLTVRSERRRSRHQHVGTRLLDPTLSPDAFLGAASRKSNIGHCLRSCVCLFGLRSVRHTGNGVSLGARLDIRVSRKEGIRARTAPMRPPRFNHFHDAPRLSGSATSGLHGLNKRTWNDVSAVHHVILHRRARWRRTSRRSSPSTTRSHVCTTCGYKCGAETTP